MYAYTYDSETGGLLLNDSTPLFSKEPRPVYAREMDILGFDKRWKYEKQDDFPYMWAESNMYWYRGIQAAKTRGGSLYVKPEIEYLMNADGGPAVPEGETLLPVDLSAMSEKNRELLEILEQMTVKKIFDVYKRYRKKLDCFHVAFSGGKDSIVLLELVRKALPQSSFVVVFGDTGMEFPDTYEVIDRVEEQCRQEKIEFYRASSHLSPEESWRLFGPPSRVLRWCCSVHKSTPQVIKLREILGKPDYQGLAFVGVRAHESMARSQYEYENYGKKQKGQYSHNPLLEWTSAEIWLYIYYCNLLVNDTYKTGNSRAGCIFCPMGGGKSDYFRNISYPEEIKNYTSIIQEMISPSYVDSMNSYLENSGWGARSSGRDLAHNPSCIQEDIRDDYIHLTIANPRSDWKEWIKTCPDVPYNVKITQIGNVLHVQIPSVFYKTAQGKILKQVFLKTAYCIGCRSCETNCPYGCISFQNGIHITNCRHCTQCHAIPYGCHLADSRKKPMKGNKMPSLNTFEEHAPKIDWVESFFTEGNEFWDNMSLGPNQTTKFKRFLKDANLIQGKFSQITHFFECVKKIQWNSDVAWGLILVNLVHHNPQMKWYVQNLNLENMYLHQDVKMKLEGLVTRPNTIISAFGRLCEMQLGTILNFGTIEKNTKNEITSLTRTKTRIFDERVILYSLYKFAEACDGYYQFTLARLMNFSVESAGISPAQIFGLDRDEMERFLNALSVKYPEFIHVTFTHDLDKIDLREDKKSEDVLSLF